MNYNHEPIVFDTTPQELTQETKSLLKDHIIEMKRKERNKLLLESDIYTISDYPISLEDKMKILTYRQELRDFNFNDFSKVFPIKPFNK
jgi:hypothetical protein